MSNQQQHWDCASCDRKGVAEHKKGASTIDVFVAVLDDHARVSVVCGRTPDPQIMLNTPQGKRIQPWFSEICEHSGVVEYYRGTTPSEMAERIHQSHLAVAGGPCTTPVARIRIKNMGYYRGLAQEKRQAR